jgi:hypothetical protein
MIARRIGTVHVALIDPHPRNQGRGIEMLRDAGVRVVTNFLSEEASVLISPKTLRLPPNRGTIRSRLHGLILPKRRIASAIVTNCALPKGGFSHVRRGNPNAYGAWRDASGPVGHNLRTRNRSSRARPQVDPSALALRWLFSNCLAIAADTPPPAYR